MLSSFLALFIIQPKRVCLLNIALLFLLCSPSEKNNPLIAVFAEINPIARPEIDFAFKYATAYAFNS